MYELSIEKFTRYVVRMVEKLDYNVTLDNPDSTESFPLAVVNNPMEVVKYTENNIPVLKRMSISVEWWCNSKYEAMKHYQETNDLLRKYNFMPIGGQTDSHDQVTQKYRYGSRYEVNYNGLTNSFERII